MKVLEVGGEVLAPGEEGGALEVGHHRAPQHERQEDERGPHAKPAEYLKAEARGHGQEHHHRDQGEGPGRVEAWEIVRNHEQKEVGGESAGAQDDAVMEGLHPWVLEEFQPGLK